MENKNMFKNTKTDVKNRTVTYINEKETVTKKGGTISWRTNNPGNLS
jgi:hypothetical protein